MSRLPEPLQTVEKLNDEAAGEDSSATRSALGSTHLGNALLSRADDHDMLLTIEAAAAHTHKRPEAERTLQSLCLLLVCRLASPRAEKCAQHALREASIEFRCLFDYQNCADEVLLTAREANVLEHNRSFLLRPGRQEIEFSCSR